MCPHLTSWAGQKISIHSLRVEGDQGIFFAVLLISHISIHSLRVEGDKIPIQFFAEDPISIHSLRVEGDNFGQLG